VAARTLNGVEILSAEWRGQEIEYLEGEILVGLNVGRIESELAGAIDQLPVKIVRHADRFGFMKLRSEGPADLFNLIDMIEALPMVRYAEPNMVDHLLVIPNDPDFDKQWHYHNTGQSPPGGTVDADIDAPEGWDISTGSNNVIVGVLDSGIPMVGGQLSHPDLDDPTKFLIGIDISGGDDEPMDENGHGTHVSGTIAAETDNFTGVAGVSWNAKVMAIQVFNRYGSGSHENFRDGCIYGVDNGCKVLNYSGGGSAGATKEHGVAYADSHGVVLCAAAGNNWQGSVSWPGAYSVDYANCICVSSSNHHDQSSPFSSIGPEVTICAPGGQGSPFDTDDVWSTFPNYEYQIGIDYGLPQSYGPLAGTSMATPHVAGLCALILGVNPSLTPDSVRQILINTSDDLGPAGFDNQFGWGRINVYNALSQMQLLSISHTPLPDTKDTLNDYEVVCSILSDTALVADSTFMRYQIGLNSYDEVLQPTGQPDEYHAFIPAQSAGTNISYQLFALNERGDADTTALFSFRVIDYAVSLSPEFSASTGAVDDTVWHPFTVVNDGIFADTFGIDLLMIGWTTYAFDISDTSVIDRIGPLAPDESAEFLVGVIVPPSVYGELDSARVRLTSLSTSGVFDVSRIQTTSAGQPLQVPFFEFFTSTTLSPARWVESSGVQINSVGLGEPSEPYSLNFNGSPDGGDYVVSQAIDLGGLSGVNISYYYQRGGGGEQPDAGDDLFVEYMDAAGEWQSLNQHLGEGAQMSNFEMVTLGVPLDGYHSGFRLKFYNTATSGNYDDWFVDDIRIDWGPEISISPASFSHTMLEGDSLFDQLIIANAGPGGLTYSINLLPYYSASTVFGALYQSGRVNPPSYDWFFGEDVEPPLPFKGGDEGPPGAEVIYDAGGPDNFGYVWIDSDEPTGPTFNWIDILATGTDITSGLDDDNFTGPFPIGFDFPYYDGFYQQFWVSSNGFIGFGPTGDYGSLSNSAIPVTSTPNNIIAWCWDDLNPDDGNNPDARVVYENIGSATVIQFDNYPEYSAAGGDVIDAEIILYQDGRILLQYGDIGAGFDLLSSSVGIENQDGTDGLQVAHNASYLHDSLAIEFIKPAQWLILSATSGELAAEEADTIELQFGSAEIDSGYYKSDIQIFSNDPDPQDNPMVSEAELWVYATTPYVCGDATGDEMRNVSDVVFLIAYVFGEGPPPDPMEAGDVNCDENINVTDVTYLIAFIFGGGAEPCADCP
jgi:subtilisin family serine protease